jgi:hypothetical protein
MPVLMWVASRSSLLHLSTCRTARSQATRAQLKRHGCEYHSYTLDRYQHPFIVYMRRNHFSKHEYIGYSACGMTNREMSRSRKYRQRSLVSKEPALIWWETHQEDRLNFYNWVNIVIKTTDSKIQAKILDMLSLLIPPSFFSCCFSSVFIRGFSPSSFFLFSPIPELDSGPFSLLLTCNPTIRSQSSCSCSEHVVSSRTIPSCSYNK